MIILCNMAQRLSVQKRTTNRGAPMGKGGQGLYPPGTVTLDGGPFAGPRG